MSLAIGGPIMGGTLLAQGIAQAIEDQRPENKLNQADWISRQTGGTNRALGARAQQQTAAGIRGAQKDASGFAGQMGPFGRYAGGFVGGLIDPDVMRRIKARSMGTAAAQSQGLTAQAAQEQNTLRAASQNRVAGFGKAVGQLASPFMPELDIPKIGKVDLGELLQFGTAGAGQLAQAGMQQRGGVSRLAQQAPTQRPLFNVYDFGY